MRKFYLLGVVILVVLACLNIKCSKINKDQPCGLYKNNTQQLYRSDDKCYYIDSQNDGKKTYVDTSVCACFK